MKNVKNKKYGVILAVFGVIGIANAGLILKDSTVTASGSAPYGCGNTLRVGDKLFSDFSICHQSSGCYASKPSYILVQGVTVDGDYGIRVSGSWIAGSCSSLNTVLRYKVSVVPESDQFISGSTLELTSAGVQYGRGEIELNSTIYSNRHPSSLLAELSTYYSSYAGSDRVDSSLFEVGGVEVHKKSVWVETDLSLYSSICSKSYVCGFTQTFQQIPEPASAMMLGLGGLIIAAVARRFGRI